MSCGKPLAFPTDIVYRYDGGLEGFYTCVHESVYLHQLPLGILSEDAVTLLPARFVVTDRDKALKVRQAVAQKLTFRTRNLVETVFLSCLQDREMHLLKFLLLAFREGAKVLDMLAEPDVNALYTAEKHLLHEAHLLTGFVRFSDVEGKLMSTIRPKNFVLPFLADHFCDRFGNEDFLIYDATHRAALLGEHGLARIVPVDMLEPPKVSREEAEVRALWKRFYQTLSIKERENLACRRSHMPKRYWSEMTEMVELL